MGSMFNNCSSLTSLDVLNFDTGQVAQMAYMFYNCSSLTSLDVSNFNTSQVTNMQQMFQDCSSLKTLDVSNWDTSQVADMQNLFDGCSPLTTLDVSNWDTSQVTNMQYLFYNCSSLKTLDVSNWDTSQVTTVRGLFYGCSSLKTLDVSNWDTSQVADMQSLFDGCSSLTTLDVSNWDTSQVTNMQSMFHNCSSLTSLDVSNFDTSQVANMTYMFYTCSSLTSLDVSNFNTSKVTTMVSMFYNCSSLKLLDISNFNIKHNYITQMFDGCNLLTNIGLLYAESSTINKLINRLLTSTTEVIWYMNAKLEDLTKKENIIYKEYKMNILESDEEINLHRIGDVYDELNLETGELTQRIGEIVLDGRNDEGWIFNSSTDTTHNFYCSKNERFNTKPQQLVVCDNLPSVLYGVGIRTAGTTGGFNLTLSTETMIDDVAKLKDFLSQNPLMVQYELAQPVIKTINLKGKPSIDWQGDTYLHLENNTLYPQLDCEIESINYYEIPKLKANTLYTLRYVGEPTECIFGGLTYKTENNMILTSGSSDNLLYFDKEVRKVVLIEGDVRDRNFDYFEGIESLGAVEIVTHKTNMPIFAKGGRK